MLSKVFIILILIALIACTSGNKSEENQTVVSLQENIPEQAQALFNGKTLDNWEITNFGTQGPVRVSGGKIVIGMGDGCSGINFTEAFPKVNYEVGLDARKTSGNDFFCGLTFPVNEKFCSLIVGGWGGPVVGLSTIDGIDASENETETLMRFEKDQWYNIRLKVSESKITAWIDDELVVDFDYQNRELGIRPEVSLSRPLGICTWMTTAEIKNIWFREFSE
ncbi:3-keto-disaccharide hydrolase [Maribellus mangrovi]|uniref:3-keto-disaccharide hydrolase n=1 Tax=Maribellus mangrovi TaxID=3133146 RepID=UPI0030ECF7EA